MGTIYRNGHQYVGQNTDSASLIFLDDERSVQEGVDDAEDSITQLNNDLSDISYANASWTPAVTGQTVTGAIGRCVRVGRFRYAYAAFNLGASIPAGSSIEINGIPNGYEPQTAFQTVIQCVNISKGIIAYGRAYEGKFYIYNFSSTAFEAGNMIIISAVYFY